MSVPDSFGALHKETDIPVYPEIASHRDSNKLSAVLSGLPTCTQTATLNIPGYLFHAASTSVLFVASLAFWLQFGFLIYTGQVGWWWSIVKLAVFPTVLTLSFLLSLRILTTPGALLGGFLRFTPMVALLAVAGLMALRMAGIAMHPDFSEAVQNAGFLLDMSWLVVGGLVSLITCWSWAMRTDGHSFLNPWIIDESEDDYSWNKRQNDRANARARDLEAGSEELALASGQTAVGAVLTKTVPLLTGMASLVTTLYLGTVLFYGVGAGMSPPMISVMVPLLISSMILATASIAKAASVSWVLANALLAAVGLAVLGQCIWPDLFGTSFIALQPGDAAIFAAPLHDLASLVTATPVFSDLNALTSGLSPLDLLRGEWSASPVTDVAQAAPTGFAGFLSRAGDFVRDNFTPARMGAVIMTGVVVLNILMFVVAPPLGATAMAGTSAIVSTTTVLGSGTAAAATIVAAPAATTGIGGSLVYAFASAMAIL